jgi:hypothetical protein
MDLSIELPLSSKDAAPVPMLRDGHAAMRKVILFVQVSLDGFFEGPKKEIDWHMVDDELHAHVIEELKAMGAFLNGRVTYELMAGFWPTADADPGSAPSVKEFARIWRDIPKVVYSKTLTLAGWNTTIARQRQSTARRTSVCGNPVQSNHLITARRAGRMAAV